ncbi:MAG: DUF1330 domain-containing protein [Paracoccaceae bacterium]
MPKGYWIAQFDVTDPAAYEAYRTANAIPFGKFGARFVVRGGAQQVREGDAKSRTVVIEFKDLVTAIACYESAEYQAAKAIRAPASVGDLMIVEGYDG